MLNQVIDTLSAIGLSLARDKCKFIASPDLGTSPLVVRDIVIPQVTSFSFLGVLIGFGVSCRAVLSARLSLTQNSFWGYYKILNRPGGAIRTRLNLLNTFVTSKWRWLSPCLRPTSTIQNMLKIMHTTLLTSLCGLTADPFVSSSTIWVTRRRASRMIAQAVGHKVTRAGMGYKPCFFGSSGIGPMLHAFSFTACHQSQSPYIFATLIGSLNLVASYVVSLDTGLQLAYEKFRSHLDPPAWEQKALDKTG